MGQVFFIYRTEAKRRLISAAPFRDRVVHHALVGVIEPLFEKRFIYDSYANRIGKGTHRALNRCTQYMRTGGYVLPCDIGQFFPGIDHGYLLRKIRKITPQEDVLWLIEAILKNGAGVLDEVYDLVWFTGDDLFSPLRPRGLPLGNLTSQFWANVYLDDLDQFVKRELKVKRYLRYVDDFLLFSENKPELRSWKNEISTFLAGMRLTIHESQAQPRPVDEGLPFLGFIVYPDHRRLKSTSGRNFQRRLRTLYADYKQGKIERGSLEASLRGWITHAAHGDTWGLRKSILSEIVM